jgi:GNAT superfamily N-acetyltransferase
VSIRPGRLDGQGRRSRFVAGAIDGAGWPSGPSALLLSPQPGEDGLMTNANTVGLRPGPAEAQPVVLRDGTVVVVQRMAGDDGERLVRFHASLSVESQYLRFFGSHTRLTEREVDRFTHVDHRDREAYVAVLDGEIVGVGRFDRLAGGDEAEVAFVVTDRLQGRGLGSALIQRVMAGAIDAGVDRLLAETMLQNHRMLSAFRHAGPPVTTRLEDGIVHVTMSLTGCA